MTKDFPLRRPAVMIFSGIYIIWGFGYETVLQRLLIDVDGTIISSKDVPPEGGPRYGTEYVLRSDSGAWQTYRAGATDASLRRRLRPGVKLVKRRWELGYTIDEKWVSFPIYFYGPILAGALFLVGYGTIKYYAIRRGAPK